MMFQDQEISCGECGTRFGFSSEEQAFYADKGLVHPPRRCKACRMTRKQQREGGRPGPPSARGHRDHPAAGPPAGGPFVRRNRRNSHGDHDNLPWHRGGSERQAAGVWQPRHGKGPWKGGGWRAQPAQDAPPARHGSTAPRDQRGGNRAPRSGAGHQGRGPRGGRNDDGGAPLFKANFGPLHDQQQPRREHGRPAWQGDNKRARADRGPLVLHDTVCSDCSQATQVPFKPHHKLPVFCRTCLPKHKKGKSPPRGPSAGRS